MNTDTDTTPDSDENQKQSRIISKVLSPAVQLWLRSLIEQVSNLEVKISGSDRSLLTGKIRRISILASGVVYQGLHLSQIHLVGENICINLGQVLRGKPLRLLEPVSVSGELLLKEADLNSSVRSPMLANALTELLTTLLPPTYTKGQQLSCNKITLNSNQLIINADLVADDNNLKSIVIHTILNLASCHQLLLQSQVDNDIGLPSVNLDDFTLDLGSEVNIQELSLSPGQLICRGRIKVLP